MGNEFCDDEDINDNVGCAPGCKAALPKWTCTTNPSTKKSDCIPKCKDGFVLENEECDAGSDPILDGCTADCKGTKPEWVCEGGDPEKPSKCI